ncbi:MAG TPA: AAA family ATPase [Mucilaginibacter sp.]
MKPIILLSGPVGAGKTTVARELVKAAYEPIVHIEGDVFWSFIGKSIGSPKKNFGVIMSAMTAAAIPFALSGYEIILDFSVPPRYLDRLLKILKRREIPLDYVVIRPDKFICTRRAIERSEGQIKDYSHYEKLYDAFDEVQKHIIYDNESDAETIAEHIREGLGEGIFHFSG